MNRIIQIYLLFSLMLMLVACGEGDRSANTTTNPMALEKADALMMAMLNQDYEGVIQHYPDEFFSRMPPEGWVDMLKTHDKDRGPMHSFELKKTQADTRFSGKFYILEYMAVHDGNKRANHIITLLAPVDGGDMIIVGHKISSWVDEREPSRP